MGSSNMAVTSAPGVVTSSPRTLSPTAHSITSTNGNRNKLKDNTPTHTVSHFDINSLMMAAAAAAAAAQNNNKVEENHLDDDESDSNYLNKLRRKLDMDGDELNENQPEQNIAKLIALQQSGAKKRKRQLTSNNGLTQANNGRLYENDEADGDEAEVESNDTEKPTNRKHLKLMENNTNDETKCGENTNLQNQPGIIKPVSRRKSKINYINNMGEEDEGDENINNEEEETCLINGNNGQHKSRKDSYYSSQQARENDDQEIGERFEEIEEEDYDDENGELKEGIEDGEELEQFEEDEINVGGEDIERASKKSDLYANSFRGITNIDNIKNNNFFQPDYGSLNQQALIANTLANLAANFNNGQLSQAGNVIPGSKIFHVDAYCYLCKKEFCNKYFLRTHLANKHKVFLNNNELSTLSGASMSKLQNDLLDEQNKNKKSKLNINGSGGGASGSQTEHRSSSASSSASTNSSVSSSASNSPVPQQQQHQLQQSQQMQQLQQNQSSPSSSQTSSNTIANVLLAQQQKQPLSVKAEDLQRSLSESSSVEDFCELCNKQFCNKYYLKVRILNFKLKKFSFFEIRLFKNLIELF